MNPFVETMRPVWENAQFVSVDKEALERLVQNLKTEKLEIPNWRLPCLPEEDDENFVQFLGVTTAINFCFWDPWTRERYRFIDKTGKEWQGATAMSMAMKEAWERGVPILDAEFLSSVGFRELHQVFKSNESQIPLFAERTRILNHVGCSLLAQAKSFWDVVESAEGHAFREGNGIIWQFWMDFPFAFIDVSVHRLTNSELHFHKKAQLFVMMYHGRALDSNGKLPLIQDIDDIGVAADYVLPKILRHYEVLVYAPELAQKVDSWQIVERRSLEEQEIRAQTWQAMILLRERLSELRDENVSMLALDYLLWRRGRAIDAPHHLTPTTAY